MEKGSGRRSRSGERSKNIEPKSEANNFPNIPEEIIVVILSRLSYDSLSRFRCVSKRWSSLISDSKLIALSKRRKVLVMSKSYDGSFLFHTIDQQCSLEKVQTPWEKNLRLYHHEVKIYGSCNGLFLLGLKLDLHLWNPLNGYFIKVLSYHRLMQPPYGITTSGLCYDSSTNGYKAVMAMDKFLMVGYFRKKCWKEVRFPYNIGTIRSGPVVNGRLHWFACNTNFVSTHCIFSFDPQVDEFKKVPLPKPPKDGERNILIGLGVLDECLSMTRLHQGRQGNAEVWVMKEYGVKKSWNLMFVTSSTFKVYSELVPLCCTDDDKVLMREFRKYDRGHVNVYNSNGDLDGDVPSLGNHKFSMQAIEYVESSVEPTGYKWEKEERRGIAAYVEQFLSAPPRKMIKGKGDSNWNYSDTKEEAEAKGSRKKQSLKRNRQ